MRPCPTTFVIESCADEKRLKFCGRQAHSSFPNSQLQVGGDTRQKSLKVLIPCLEVEVDEEDEVTESLDVLAEDMKPFQANGACIDVKMVLQQKDIQGLGPNLLVDTEEGG